MPADEYIFKVNGESVGTVNVTNDIVIFGFLILAVYIAVAMWYLYQDYLKSKMKKIDKSIDPPLTRIHKEKVAK